VFKSPLFSTLNIRGFKLKEAPRHLQLGQAEIPCGWLRKISWWLSEESRGVLWRRETEYNRKVVTWFLFPLNLGS
jgi:hypothetical protein